MIGAAAARTRVAVVTCDPLSDTMAGPGIRATAVAALLSAEHDVRLVTTRTIGDDGLRELERWCDVLVFQGWVMNGRSFLEASDKVLVADLYDPMHLEQLEQARHLGPQAWARTVRATTDVLNRQLGRADFFLCASTRQRDFWLGHLAALGRVNPSTYGDDPTLARLIRVAPFGIPEEPPEHTRAVVKGVVEGIAPDDRLVLWGGGVYDWLDPATLIRAIDAARHRVPAIRLLFMGMRHPSPEVPVMAAATEARALADDLGLTGRHVFFHDGWVDYADRQNYLLEADVGVSTHRDHLETALSFRTRILDYLWASLPVVATRGDVLADLVDSRGLGLTVAPGDVDALSGALVHALQDGGVRRRWKANAEALKPELTWPVALAPLVEFCRSPRKAADAGGTGPGAPPHWSVGLRTGVAGLRRTAARGVAELRRAVSAQG